MLAIDFGLLHKSCREAMEWRRSLGPDATQADAWRQCHRGDWMIWQLERIGHPVPRDAIERMVARAIRRGQRSLRGVRAPWATEWRRWARDWLSGEDRSREAARAAWAARADAAAWVARAATRAARAEAAAEDAARAVELRLQARDLRLALPEWPEEETNASD